MQHGWKTTHVPIHSAPHRVWSAKRTGRPSPTDLPARIHALLRDLCVWAAAAGRPRSYPQIGEHNCLQTAVVSARI
jgi:hypothetical protein